MTGKQDVIVVGGGLAGLATATLLGRQDLTVSLYEKAGQPGGRATSQIRGEFRFNQGPHALYHAGAARRILQELQIDLAGGRPDLDGLAIFEGKLGKLPTRPRTIMEASWLSLAARWELVNFFRKFAKIDPASLNNMSLENWLAAEIKQPRLRQFLLAMARVTTYSNAPAVQNAGDFVTQLQMSLKGGVWYLDGGWQRLVDGLAQAARQAGVSIISGCRVEQVVRRNETEVSGVQLSDGEIMPADAVVLATGNPGQASELIDQGRHPVMSRWAALTRPVKAACLDLALEQLPVPGRVFALGIDQPLYYSVHSAVARFGPKGKVLLHAAYYLPAEDRLDSKGHREVIEKMLDLVQPGWQKQVIDQRFLPSLTVYHEWPVQTASPAPSPVIPGLTNLYLAGDWLKTGALLADAALSSAEQVATQILSRLNPATLATAG